MTWLPNYIIVDFENRKHYHLYRNQINNKNNNTEKLLIYYLKKKQYSNSLKLLQDKRARKKINMNACEPDLGTPLFIVALQNNSDINILTMLLKEGADINYSDDCGNSVLHHMAIRSTILVDDSDDSEDDDGDVQLEEDNLVAAVDIPNDDIYSRKLKLLLDNGCNINITNIDKVTALHLACSEQNATCVKVLLENHAYVNPVDNNNVSPIHIAAYEGNYEILSYLLDNNADANILDVHNNTPLHYASITRNFRTNYYDLIKKLIERGADVNIRNTNYGEHPLFLFIRRASNLQEDDEKLVKLFIEHGADINVQRVNCSNMKRDTMLHVAVRNQNVPLCIILLKNNADLSIRNADQQTAIDIAERFNDGKMHALINNYVEYRRYNDVSEWQPDLPNIHRSFRIDTGDHYVIPRQFARAAPSNIREQIGQGTVWPRDDGYDSDGNYIPRCKKPRREASIL
jgi:ankyrin repeat protein